MHGRPLLPVLPALLVLNCIVATLIALRLRWWTRLAGFAVYTYLLYLAFRCTAGDVWRDYVLGCHLMDQYFVAIQLLWLTDPMTELRHERDAVHPSTLPFARRFYWSLCVLNNRRGVGWNCQVAIVPPRPSGSRRQFVRERLLKIFRLYIPLDFIQLYVLSIRPETSPQRWIYGLGRLSTMMICMEAQTSIISIVAVVTRFSEPQDWPAVFGKLSDAYTVRRFWGRTYHQNVRRYTASWGKRACRLLGLQPGSWASAHMQLFVGFSLSCLMHCAGDLMVRPSIFGASSAYFAAQAAVIALEDVVVAAARRRIVVPVGVARFAGYAWVVLWLGVSTPWLFNWTVKAGVVDSRRLPFSILEALICGKNTGFASRSVTCRNLHAR
ncbi:hypothetical protein WOLCODRAFT_146720 [Wolfiporia cocos MD-104 SS10]|uniref:Wax synthase domain-containing protein n=1 Tax=Wolfiporia cocos (strain MD-104) TaxID=742152 RepID=A0A2H3JFP1_WOLCO|nr:hypothetical protein WOLCODRAFT_146720 [Wolfiporia cocos MD-104 SS10]